MDPQAISEPGMQNSVLKGDSSKQDQNEEIVLHSEGPASGNPLVEYKLYRRRFVGATGMVLLNIGAAMPWPWFGPISNTMSEDFDISLDRVNWLGNMAATIYLPTALIIPVFCSRYGFRRCCDVGAIFLILSAWIRYAGTAKSLSTNGAYALLLFGQFFSSLAQPVFQVLGPKYSETWFDLKGRTTATMVIAIANPIGGALGQLISPLVGSTRQSILVLGIITTIIAPTVLFIGSAPPTPPTFAGSKSSPTFVSLLSAICGYETSPATRMSVRERIDFVLVTVVFGVLVGAVNAFSILTSQIFKPVGYSDDISGLMGATLLLTGIVAAILTAPLFDRVLTHHLAISIRCLVPVFGVTWLSLIWAVKPNNMAGLFIIMTIIGVTGITVLPVGLELGVELTRNADGSSAILWFAANLIGVIFILSESALRAGSDARPPLNMKRALVFTGVVVMFASALVFFIKGKQARKELDEVKNRELEESRQGITLSER